MLAYPSVICISDFWYPKFGGMERSIENLCRELPGECEVQVLTQSSGSDAGPAFPFRVRAFPSDADHGYYAHALDWIRASRAPRVVHVFGFSFQWPRAQAAFLEACAALEATSVVMKVPTLGDASRYLGSSHAATARHVNRFVALSDEMRRELVACGIPPSRIACLPNGVRVSQFRPADAASRRSARQALGLPADRLLLGFCGRFERRKRIDLLVSAVRDSRAQGRVGLVLVGEPDHTFGTGFDVGELVADNVIWLREQSDIRPAYHAFDVYLTASMVEGMSNSVLEAMSSGLPIVASDIPGHRELVAPGVNGILFQAGQCESLVEALSKITERAGEEGLAAWGRASRDRACAEFDQSRISACYAELYRELARARP